MVEMGQPMARIRLDDYRPSAEWAAVSGRLLRMAKALTASLSDAEDLTQQTLAKLLVKHADRVDHVGLGRRTMLRLWLDHQRSLHRRVARMARAAYSAKRWHVDPDRLSATERERAVRRAIASLPPKQRAVLVLRLVEELDYGAIGEALGCSTQTVRAHLHLGRRRVRKMLGEQP